MRVIVTEQGGEIMKFLSQNTIIQKAQKSPVTNENKNKNSPKKINKNKNLNKSGDSLDLSERKGSNGLAKILENEKSLNNIKVIEIKNKKLSIPKNIAEKYNEIRLNEISLLPVLHHTIGKSNQNHNSNYKRNSVNLFESTEDAYGSNVQNTKSFNNNETMETDPSSKMHASLKVKADPEDEMMRTSYKMSEIITDKAMENIKSNIISGVKMKNRLTNVMQTNFRLPFLTPTDKLIDIEGALEKKIKSDKANIIQYLNSKNCLSPKFIKSLSNYDEEKIVRLNKVCQRVFNQDNKDNDLKMKINGIIENMHVYQKAEYKKQMGQLEKEVSGIKSICEKYPKQDNREKYENLLHEIKTRYWDPLNVDKLSRKNMKTEH